MADGVAFTWDDTQFAARLQRYVNQFPGQAEETVAKVALRVLADIKIGWPVDTGASRAAWVGPRKVAPLAYQLSNAFVYAKVIEYGAFGLGPKTVPAGGETLPGSITVNRGIYARQRPAAPVRRALAKAYGVMGAELAKALR
jgi:hypothetical protein